MLLKLNNEVGYNLIIDVLLHLGTVFEVNCYLIIMIRSRCTKISATGYATTMTMRHRILHLPTCQIKVVLTMNSSLRYRS